MALTLVQSNDVESAAGSTNPSITFSAATAGNLLIVGIRAGVVEASVTGPAGYTKRVGGNDATAANCVQIYRKIATGGETSAAFTTPASTTDIGFMEFSGATTWTDDVAPAVNAPSGTATSCPTNATGTLTAAAEVVVAYCALVGGANSGSEAIDSGFTVIGGTNSPRLVFGYKITTVNTTLTPTLSWATARGRVAGICSFYDSGVASVQRGIGASSMGMAPPSSGAFSMGVNL